MKLDWLPNLPTKSKTTKSDRVRLLDDLDELLCYSEQYSGTIVRHPDGERLLITTPQGEEYVLDVAKWSLPKTQEELRAEEERKESMDE